MAAGKKRKKGRKIRLKHPEVYAYLFFIGLIMYTILVIDLYRSKRTKAGSKQPRPVYNPLTLVSRSYIQTLIPDDDEAVIFAPDSNLVTSKTVVIFVQSDYSNTERRQLIRHTWANSRYYGNDDNNASHDHNNGNNNNNNNVKRDVVVLFAVGTREETGEDTESSLNLEMSEHNDILLFNIVDVYDSLTVKGLLAMTWIYENLKQVNYVIKTDDDVFLNMFAWIDAVESLDAHNVTCVMAGFVWTNPNVLRSGKYQVGKDAYEPDLFPAFCSGAAYIMSRDSMAAILEASAYIPLLVRDDPYYTGILAQTMGVSLLTFPKETLRFDEYFGVEHLNTKPVMAVHRLGTRQWYRLWNALRNRHRLRIGRHRIKLRPVYVEEGGLRLMRLSKALNRTLENECLSDTVFGDVILT